MNLGPAVVKIIREMIALSSELMNNVNASQ